MKKNLIILILLFLSFNIYSQNIHRVACKGDLKKLDSLLSDKSVNIKDNLGRSLLHWVVACKQKEVYHYLIKKGIKINVLDNQGKSPLHIAAEYNNIQLFNNLLNLQKNNNWITRFGTSLLQIAVMKKNKALINLLAQNGVDFNGKNKRGSTALEISNRMGLTDISETLLQLGANPNLVKKIKMKGKYMGLKRPDTIPELFAPNFISTEEQEFGSVFNKTGNEFYYGVDVGKTNEIRFTKMINGEWTKPKTILSHKRYNFNDPFLSNDEKRLYFISKRPLSGQGEPKDVDIWYIKKTDTGWSKPINAGKNINTTGNEYYISFTNNGTMYFASNGHPRKDTSRKDHDIYYSKMVKGKFQKPILLSSSINTTSYEADIFVAPDESYLIFCSERDEGFGRGDLYISFKGSDGKWSKAVNMGDKINTENYEYCPFVTKDGKYLLYTSNQDIYWVSTKIFKNYKYLKTAK